MRGTTTRFGQAMGAAALAVGVLVPAGAASAQPKFGPVRSYGRDSNWAGYVATAGPYTHISGGWTEPQVTCKGNYGLFAPWVGIDGAGSSTVEQTGVQTECENGVPVYSGWYEMYPAAPVYYSNPVSAGDTIDASVTYAGNQLYDLTLTDVTQGWTQTVQRSLSAQNASAEAVVEGPGGFPGIPDGVTFRKVTVDGSLLSALDPTRSFTGRFVPERLRGGTFTVRRKPKSAAS